MAFLYLQYAIEMSINGINSFISMYYLLFTGGTLIIYVKITCMVIFSKFYFRNDWFRICYYSRLVALATIETKSSKKKEKT